MEQSNAKDEEIITMAENLKIKENERTEKTQMEKTAILKFRITSKRGEYKQEAIKRIGNKVIEELNKEGKKIETLSYQEKAGGFVITLKEKDFLTKIMDGEGKKIRIDELEMNFVPVINQGFLITVRADGLATDYAIHKSLKQYGQILTIEKGRSEWGKIEDGSRKVRICLSIDAADLPHNINIEGRSYALSYKGKAFLCFDCKNRHSPFDKCLERIKRERCENGVEGVEIYNEVVENGNVEGNEERNEETNVKMHVETNVETNVEMNVEGKKEIKEKKGEEKREERIDREGFTLKGGQEKRKEIESDEGSSSSPCKIVIDDGGVISGENEEGERERIGEKQEVEKALTNKVNHIRRKSIEVYTEKRPAMCIRENKPDVYGRTERVYNSGSEEGEIVDFAIAKKDMDFPDLKKSGKGEKKNKNKKK
jgi:hypothetical protein